MANSLKSGIYLQIDDAAGAAERLAAALSVTPVSALLLAPRVASPGDLRSLVQLAQRYATAAMVAGDPALALACGADGVHLDWAEDAPTRLVEVRRQLGARSIVGAVAGPLRHDAMEMGEAGADYVGFGPDDQLARIEWWAEVFEVPCVALGVTETAEAINLARAGADFIGWRIGAGQSPAAVADGMRALVQALASAAGANK